MFLKILQNSRTINPVVSEITCLIKIDAVCERQVDQRIQRMDPIETRLGSEKTTFSYNFLLFS